MESSPNRNLKPKMPLTGIVKIPQVVLLAKNTFGSFFLFFQGWLLHAFRWPVRAEHNAKNVFRIKHTHRMAFTALSSPGYYRAELLGADVFCTLGDEDGDSLTTKDIQQKRSRFLCILTYRRTQL